MINAIFGAILFLIILLIALMFFLIGILPVISKNMENLYFQQTQLTPFKTPEFKIKADEPNRVFSPSKNAKAILNGTDEQPEFDVE